MTTEIFIEEQWDGDIKRNSAVAGTEVFEQIFEEVVKVFPWVNPREYLAVSTPTFNSAFNSHVITGTLSYMITNMLYGNTAGAAARKFDLENKMAYSRHYELPKEGFKLDGLPPSVKILGVGINHDDLPVAAPKGLDTQDIYIKADPEEMEKTFNLPVRRGKYSTFYGVSYKDNKILRVKQYIYDRQSPLSDWDIAYLIKMKNVEPERYARLIQ